MKILYFSTTLPNSIYLAKVLPDDKTDQQSQKFNRAIMRGFVENGNEVIGISRRSNVILEKDELLYEDGICYACISDSNKGLLKYLDVKKECERYIDNNIEIDENTVIFSDVLNISLAYSAISIAKKCKCKCYGIVTDVPGIYNSGIMAYINRMLMLKCDGYVYLTEQMNDLLNKGKKPYVIMEGICASHIETKEVVANDKFIVLYAGALDAKFGIEELLEVVPVLGKMGMELHLFGIGDCVEKIVSLSRVYPELVYEGLRDNYEVVEAEQRADLLINPRSMEHEFTKYSFPSKTIEYMSTGTPVLMQPLPGVPLDYNDYLFFYDGREEGALKRTLLDIKSMTGDDLKRKGNSAREFVLTMKNEKAQTRRILSGLNLMD